MGRALAEIYTMHSFAPFWNRIPKNEENRGGKRSWSNPGKTGQEERIGSSNLLPSTTTGARDLNKSHVRSMRPYMAYEDNRRVPFLLSGFLINVVPFF